MSEPSSIKAEWIPVSIPGKPWLSARYSVSTDGKVRGEVSGRILAPLLNSCGYHFYHLAFKGKVSCMMAHRIVALAFIKNPGNKPEVNHKNGIKADNRAENLEWMTSSENKFHSVNVLKRKCPSGTENGMSTLTDSDIKEIRAWWKTGDVRLIDLGARWGVSFQHVSLIVRNKRWRHVA